MMDILLAVLAASAPHFLELLGALVAALISWAAVAVQRKWGLDIEARHREALHSALMTGARMALDRALSPQSAAELAVAYARESVPDAMRKLQPSPEVLANLARAKLAEARR